jgi:hypothetical protein
MQHEQSAIVTALAYAVPPRRNRRALTLAVLVGVASVHYAVNRVAITAAFAYTQTPGWYDALPPQTASERIAAASLRVLQLPLATVVYSFVQLRTGHLTDAVAVANSLCWGCIACCPVALWRRPGRAA